jgi:flagellar basal body rod protein FlgG
MKKIIGILLFALPFASLNAQTTTDVVTESTGVIESINGNGTGTLRDTQTGQLKTFLTRDGEFHWNGHGAFVLIVGTPVTYTEITTPNGKVIVNDIKTGHM